MLHKYDNAKVGIHNTTAADDKKKSKVDFNDLSYKKRAQMLINSYIKNSQGKLDINSIINDIKEGNIEDVLDRLLLMEHNTYQRDMTVHKMEELLPPNKDPNFYFKLANVWASKRQEDLTETDLRQRSVNRDTLLDYFLEDYNIAKENTLRKIKPDKKDGKVVSLSGGGEKMAA